MNEKYLDRKSKFNDKTFDKYELFYIVEEILHKNKIPCNEFKGNISVDNDYKIADWDEDKCEVQCTFNFIIYDCELPKKDFRKTAEKVEKIFREQFNINRSDDVVCNRYDDSEYASNGYDVELKLHICYAFEEEK